MGQTRKPPETPPTPGAIRVYGGKPSYYNGFTPKERENAYRWLMQEVSEGRRILQTICEACGSENGRPHSEDYSEPFGDHIGAYILCDRCHKTYLHSIRYRRPDSWKWYLEQLGQQQGKETVLHEIDRGEIRRNTHAMPSKEPLLPAHLPPLVKGWLMSTSLCACPLSRRKPFTEITPEPAASETSKRRGTPG
jgi:hypothetical protein